MITKAHIKNFKAIRDASVELTPIHLLIGPNDSGKTTVLEAIAAICRSLDHSVKESFLGRWQGRELVNSSAADPISEITLSIKSADDFFLYQIVAEFSDSGGEVEWKNVAASIGGKTEVLAGDRSHMLVPWSRTSAPNNSRARAHKAWHAAQLIQTAIGKCWYLRWTARNLSLPTALNPDRRFRIEGNGFGLPTLIDDLLNYDRENFGRLEREFVDIFPPSKVHCTCSAAGV